MTVSVDEKSYIHSIHVRQWREEDPACVTNLMVTLYRPTGVDGEIHVSWRFRYDRDPDRPFDPFDGQDEKSEWEAKTSQNIAKARASVRDLLFLTDLRAKVRADPTRNYISEDLIIEGDVKAMIAALATSESFHCEYRSTKEDEDKEDGDVAT